MTPHEIFTMIRCSILCLTLCCFCASVFGQDRKQIYHHAVFWSKMEANQIFKNKFGIGTDVVLRSKSELNSANMFKAPNRESIRLWVHYQFSENARLQFLH